MPIEDFERITSPLAYGGKSHQLGGAIRSGLPVPRGFGVSWEVVDAVVRSEPLACRDVLVALQSLAADSVAVRSSAIGEDSADASFAGHSHIGRRREFLVPSASGWPSRRWLMLSAREFCFPGIL